MFMKTLETYNFSSRCTCPLLHGDAIYERISLYQTPHMGYKL